MLQAQLVLQPSKQNGHSPALAKGSPRAVDRGQSIRMQACQPHPSVHRFTWVAQGKAVSTWQLFFQQANKPAGAVSVLSTAHLGGAGESHVHGHVQLPWLAPAQHSTARFGLVGRMDGMRQKQGAKSCCKSA